MWLIFTRSSLNDNVTRHVLPSYIGLGRTSKRVQEVVLRPSFRYWTISDVYTTNSPNVYCEIDILCYQGHSYFMMIIQYIIISTESIWLVKFYNLTLRTYWIIDYILQTESYFVSKIQLFAYIRDITLIFNFNFISYFIRFDSLISRILVVAEIEFSLGFIFRFQSKFVHYKKHWTNELHNSMVLIWIFANFQP